MNERRPSKEDGVDLSRQDRLYTQRKLDALSDKMADLKADVARNSKWLERIDKEYEQSFQNKKLIRMEWGIYVSIVFGIVAIVLSLI